MARILIIDDDNALRAWMVMTLRNAGHCILEAASGAEALAWARRQSVDVVITDVLLPEEGVVDIITLRNEFPLLPFMLVTGLVAGSERAVEARTLLRARRVLAKPFAMAELVLATAEVAAEASGAG